MENLSGEEQSKALSRLKEEKDYWVFDELPFWVNGKGITNKQRNRLYLFDSLSGELTPISAPTCNVGAVALNDDLSKIVYGGQDYDSVNPQFSAIMLYDIPSRMTKTLVEGNTYMVTRAAFYGDGVLFIGSDRKRYGSAENARFYTVSLSTGEVKLFADPDRSPAVTVTSDSRFGLGKGFQIAGGVIYSLFTLDNTSYLCRVDKDGSVHPLTADNGYFLYYNKRYITDEQARTLDGILEAAAAKGKLFAMDWSSAWYVYSFFGNTGLQVGLNDDGITNYCTWNQTEGSIRGVDVAQAMAQIAESPGFASRTDEEFLQGVKDGSVVAGVSGVWNAVAVNEAWGEDTGAAKLPTYSCNGSQVQMASFSGCKLIGVNAYSEYPEWAARLAEWITDEENQRLRFEMRGQGPSNMAVADSPAIMESPAIAALLEQSEYSQLQRVGGKFWDPVTEFAENMAAGNPSGQSLQEQLDEMAEAVCAR